MPGSSAFSAVACPSADMRRRCGVSSSSSYGSGVQMLVLAALAALAGSGLYAPQKWSIPDIRQTVRTPISRHVPRTSSFASRYMMYSRPDSCRSLSLGLAAAACRLPFCFGCACKNAVLSHEIRRATWSAHRQSRGSHEPVRCCRP